MLSIAAQYNMAASPTITSVRPAFFNKLFAMKMQESRAAVTGARTKFYVINEVIGSQGTSLKVICHSQMVWNLKQKAFINFPANV